VITYAGKLADKRFEAGYDLGEVQTAFNALEEASWQRALADLDPSELADALGLVGTLLGAGKDALARRYVPSPPTRTLRRSACGRSSQEPPAPEMKKPRRSEASS